MELPDTIRIAFDVGGVLSKWPRLFRGFINGIGHTNALIDIHVISDQHPKEELYKTLGDNGFLFPLSRVHSADYAKHGEACKAILCEELGIDILIDDFPGYVSVVGSPPVRLLVQPDPYRPYWADEWRVSKESDFGRRKAALPIHHNYANAMWSVKSILEWIESARQAAPHHLFLLHEKGAQVILQKLVKEFVAEEEVKDKWWKARHPERQRKESSELSPASSDLKPQDGIGQSAVTVSEMTSAPTDSTSATSSPESSESSTCVSQTPSSVATSPSDNLLTPSTLAQPVPLPVEPSDIIDVILTRLSVSPVMPVLEAMPHGDYNRLEDDLVALVKRLQSEDADVIVRDILSKKQ